METRNRGLDEGRSVEAKGGGFQSKIGVEQGSKVVATKEELEGAFLGRETYLAGTGKAVSCWGEVGGT